MLRQSPAQPPLKPEDIASYPEYEQRNVMTLIPVSSWTESETKLQLTYNRILQPEYLTASPATLVSAAKLTRQSWITDFAPLTIEAALYLNICAELITFYQVQMDTSSEIAALIYEDLTKSIDFTKIHQALEQKVSEQSSVIDSTVLSRLSKECEVTPKDSKEYQEKHSAHILIEQSIRRKVLINDFLEVKFSPAISTLAKKHGVLKKPIHAPQSNDDICILGAAGSGKSSIVKQFLPAEKRPELITICTDEYRGFYLPSTKHREDFKPVEQRFIRTQDSAYLIKELVEQRLRPEKVAQGRPNFYIDGMCLETWHKQLILSSRSFTSSVACLSDISLVPKRLYERAEHSSNPSDSKRHFNTTSLLTNHAMASKRLITTVPNNIKTSLYDTNVSYGDDPILMAVIENKSEHPTVVINDLLRFGNYLGKANVNVKATFGGLLFFDGTKQKYRYTYDTFYRAAEILSLSEPKPPYSTQPFDLLLRDLAIDENPYARISYISPGKYHLEVLNETVFNKLLTDSNPAAKLLGSMVMLISYGDRARHEVEILGKKGALLQAVRSLKQEEAETATKASVTKPK